MGETLQTPLHCTASLKHQTVLGPNALHTESFYFYFVVQISGNGRGWGSIVCAQHICTATAFQGPMQNIGGASSPNKVLQDCNCPSYGSSGFLNRNEIVCCCRSNQINKFLHVPHWNSNDFFHHQKWQCNSLLSLYTNAPCLSFIHIDNLCRIIYFS